MGGREGWDGIAAERRDEGMGDELGIDREKKHVVERRWKEG